MLARDHHCEERGIGTVEEGRVIWKRDEDHYWSRENEGQRRDGYSLGWAHWIQANEHRADRINWGVDSWKGSIQAQFRSLS